MCRIDIDCKKNFLMLTQFMNQPTVIETSCCCFWVFSLCFPLAKLSFFRFPQMLLGVMCECTCLLQNSIGVYCNAVVIVTVTTTQDMYLHQAHVHGRAVGLFYSARTRDRHRSNVNHTVVCWALSNHCQLQ